ncbi:unnamed protein product [Caenorhabditis angaria]|uniref:Ground-like domain-containing protein n=1 Tax=Caenorhabditis angaria TaxID=860376 RepID=A0A9P1IQW0_9PELO|nr:unnamed protein product [Caenorhabditis angaria]
MRGFLVVSAVIFAVVFGENANTSTSTVSTEPLRRIKPRRFQIDLPSVLLSDPYDGSRPKRQFSQFSQYPTYQQPPYTYQNVAQQPQYFVAQPAPYRPPPPRQIPRQQYQQRPNIVSQQYVRAPAPAPVVPRIQPRPFIPPPQVIVTPPHARIPPAYLTTPPIRHLVTNAPPRHIGYVTNTHPPKYIEPVVVTEEPWVAEISSTTPEYIAPRVTVTNPPYIAPIVTTTPEYIAPRVTVTNPPYIAPIVTTTPEYIAPRVTVTNPPYIAPRVTNPPRIETTTTEYVEEVITTTPYIAPTTTTTTTVSPVDSYVSESVSNPASEVSRTNTGYTNPPVINQGTVGSEDPYNPEVVTTTVRPVTQGYTFSTSTVRPVDPYVPPAEPRSYPGPDLTSTVGPVSPADPYVPPAEPPASSTTLQPVTQGSTQPSTPGYTQPLIPAEPYLPPAEPEAPRSYPATPQPITQIYTQPPTSGYTYSSVPTVSTSTLPPAVPVDPYVPPAEPVAPELPRSFPAPTSTVRPVISSDPYLPPAEPIAPELPRSFPAPTSTLPPAVPVDPYVPPAEPVSPEVPRSYPGPAPPASTSTVIPDLPPIDTYNEQPSLELPQNHPAPPASQSYANPPPTLTPPPGTSYQQSQTSTPPPTTSRSFPSAAPPVTTQNIVQTTTTQQTWIPEDPSPADPYFPAEAVHTPKFDESFVGQYYYGKRGEGNTTFPLPSCFYNPSGYVCCSLMLNELMTASFEETRKGKQSKCNVQKIANALQKHSEKIFDTQFETVVSYEDFSQKIHFKRDLVCKIEVEGRFILAYATPESVEAQKIIPTVPSQNIVKDDSIGLKEQLRKRIQESEEIRSIVSN